jgi:hypothetical protein
MRLAQGQLPTVCSVCLQSPAAYNEKPEYVNFESAYDGPVVKDPERAETEAGVYVEKIVVCEHCMKEAAGLLGYTDNADAEKRADAWREYAGQLEDEVEVKDRAICNLEYTVGALIDKPVKRKTGRPQFKGPESHEAEIKEMRSRQSRSEKIKKKAASGADGK